MDRTRILLALFIATLLHSCAYYRIHIHVDPPDLYNVKLNNEINKGETNPSGTADLTLTGLPITASPKITVENKKYQGYALLDSRIPLKAARNLDSLSVAGDTSGGREYSLWFLVDEAHYGRAHNLPPTAAPFDWRADSMPSAQVLSIEKYIDPNNGSTVVRLKKRPSPAKVSYWIVSNDTNNYSYFGLKRHLDRFLENNGYSWKYADTEMQDAVFSVAKGASMDSMSLNILDAALKDTLDYLVLFFGYSIGGSKQVDVKNIVSSAVLTTVGVLTAPMTGILFFAIPGKTEMEITEPSVFCTIYSVKPNKCIFRDRESLKGADQEIRAQIDAMVANLFRRIDPLLVK